MHKKKANTFVITILSFLLSVFLTMLCYLAALEFGLFNQSEINHAMEKTQYYAHVVDETIEEAQNLIIPMGLDNSVLDGVFTTQQAENDCKSTISRRLSNDNSSLDLSELDTVLTENVYQYIEAQGISLNSEQESNISTFTEAVIKIYADKISIPFISYYASVRSMFANVILIGFITLTVLSIITITLLLRLRSSHTKCLPYITYATLGAALMTTIAPAGILINGAFRRINISPEYVFRFLVQFMSDSIYSFIYIGIGMFVISFILILITSKINRANKERHLHNPSKQRI